MEVFSLLKYWRGGGATRDDGANVRTRTTETTTIADAVSHHTAETDDDDDDDDGPFFDLEFAVPDEEENDGEEQEREGDGNEEREDGIESDGEIDENDREFNFTLSSGSSGDRTDTNASLSPSDDLFFKGRLVPVEPSSVVFNGTEPNAKPQFSLLKSATKFRVLMLKLKKSKANVGEKSDPDGSAPKQENHQSQSKLFTVKFKVEEVPIISLFSRDTSSRASSGSNKSQKQQSSNESASDEKRFNKDVMHKYLKMVKPLYIRVSKRYGEKLRLSGQLRPSTASSEAQKSPESKASAVESESEGAAATDPQQAPTPISAKAQKQGKSPPPPSDATSVKQGKLPAQLRVVCKRLGKSRSASCAVAGTPPGSVQARRRDDSLLQQQDGIQSAILHCKRSFNSSRDSESSLFLRSVSDPSPTGPCT